jgi:hypothetical protein
MAVVQLPPWSAIAKRWSTQQTAHCSSALPAAWCTRKPSRKALRLRYSRPANAALLSLRAWASDPHKRQQARGLNVHMRGTRPQVDLHSQEMLLHMAKECQLCARTGMGRALLDRVDCVIQGSENASAGVSHTTKQVTYGLIGVLSRCLIMHLGGRMRSLLEQRLSGSV